MSEQDKGHCKHGEFSLLLGCPECIAERQAAEANAEAERQGIDADYEAMRADLGPGPFIVKVRYFSATRQERSQREYTYFSVDRLKLEDIIRLPVRDTITTAVVTAVDVPESEIAAFRDAVKTIPSGAIIVDIDAAIPKTEAEADSLAAAAKAAGAEVKEVNLFDQETEAEPVKPFMGVPFGEGVVATSSEGFATKTLPTPLQVISAQVGPTAADGLAQVTQEAIRIRDLARERIISSNEDLKPATNDLAIMKKVKEAIVAEKTKVVGPFKEKVDAINAAFAELLQPLEEADTLTRGKIKLFREDQQRKAAEAVRIEAEKLKLAQAEAAFMGTGEHTQELGTVVAPPPVPDQTRTGLGTQGFAAVHKWEEVDKSLIPLKYMKVDAGAVTADVKSSKGTIIIPGIRVYTDETVRINTRKGPA